MGRSERLDEMVKSAISMAKSASRLEFCIFLDKADAESEYLGGLENKLVFKGPSMPVSLLTNFLFAQSSGSIIMYGADDIIFRTQNWDSLVEESLKIPGKWLVHANDLSRNTGRIATHGFVLREYSENLGYLIPPYFEALFCDTYITWLARKSGGEIYLKDVQIEHMHPDWGKSAVDLTYERRKNRLNFLYEFFKFYLSIYEKKRDLKIVRSIPNDESGLETELH
jgi:hypothetical protein